MSQRVHGGQGRVDPTQHHNGEITPTSYERADVRIQVDSTFGAAYRLGVALNELRFFAIQAFLLDRQYVMANCLTSGTVAAALLGAVEEPIAQDYALGLERNAHASLSSALAHGDHLERVGRGAISAAPLGGTSGIGYRYLRGYLSTYRPSTTQDRGTVAFAGGRTARWAAAPAAPTRIIRR